MNGFTIYREYYELITLLTEREQQELLLAMVKYMFDNVEPTLNIKQQKVFSNLKRPLDKSKKRGQNGRTKQNQNKIKTKSKQNQNEIKEETHQDVNVIVNDNVYVNNIYSYIEDNFGRTLSPIEYELISTWEDNELTRYAIKEAVLNGKYSIKYIAAILNNFKKNSITSVQQAQNQTKRIKGKNLPEWFDKEIEDNTTEKDKQAMEELLKEFE